MDLFSDYKEKPLIFVKKVLLMVDIHGF